VWRLDGDPLTKMEKMMNIKPLAFLVATLLAAPVTADELADRARIERGAYLAGIMDCGGCHTPRGPDGTPIHEAGLSGGNVGFEIPGVGIFWPPNLTPDATGLSGWLQEDIAVALRTGVRPDGRVLVPVMPWPNYAALTDEDMDALSAYLVGLDPVEHALPPPLPYGEAAPAPFYRIVAPE